MDTSETIASIAADAASATATAHEAVERIAAARAPSDEEAELIANLARLRAAKAEALKPKRTTREAVTIPPAAPARPIITLPPNAKAVDRFRAGKATSEAVPVAAPKKTPTSKPKVYSSKADGDDFDADMAAVAAEVKATTKSSPAPRRPGSPDTYSAK